MLRFLTTHCTQKKFREYKTTDEVVANLSNYTFLGTV